MLPRVAIVGRPNVGKSAIFNRLAKRRISIVHDEPGVTRDRISAECWIGRRGTGAPFELMDTGGIGATLDDGFAKQVRAEADIAIETADLILFAVDAREGIHPIDQDLAEVLRRGKADVILIANKVDTHKTEADAAEFVELGFYNQINISAAHGRNFSELEAAIEEVLTKKQGLINESILSDRENEEEGEIDEASGDAIEGTAGSDAPIKVAIVGRPNVGKSSLINALLKDERSIVSDIAGTTRDAVDVPYERNGKKYIMIDTAGIRKRGKRDTSVEVFSVMRSERSIERADICLLVIDASSGVVTQDRRIVKMVLDSNKPCIILLNKFDLYFPDGNFADRIENFREDIGEDLFFLNYAPRLAISAKNRQYLGKIFQKIEDVVEASQNPIPTSALNKLMGFSIEKNQPPAKRGKRLKLLYATQRREDRPGLVPVPEYILFVNYGNLLTRTYERYLENQIRETYPMEGLPFVFTVRSREVKKGGKV
ncbi:ribosome biogenesis GTPase Der [Verrucomicrobiales bacterium]|nr:ribosome biogenesis GTPase Der [Verrucomicrobiales bacterium]MDC0258614.1 ribosome biogenesis GTPase Der [Verrucomicrobiales bacterium]